MDGREDAMQKKMPEKTEQELQEKIFHTERGDIHYWTNRPDALPAGAPSVALLPGLTASHRLFEKQVGAFAGRWRLFVWDAPGHAASRPFRLDFSIEDKARWLHGILTREGFARPVLVGQSMGGYVAQCYLRQFPGQAAGFVSIDSAPLDRSYLTAAELWLLERAEPMYRAIPWKLLLPWGAAGVAETAYGRQLMHDMMSEYSSREFCALAGHGYRMLARAMRSRGDVPGCPCLLLCGRQDKAGSTARLNRRWARRAQLPLVWLPGAGHNSNTDAPAEVNRLIEEFVQALPGTVRER